MSSLNEEKTDEIITQSIVIEDLPILDLTGYKSPDELKGIQKLNNIAMIIVPESFQSALYRISMSNIGSIVPIPSGEYVVISGEMKMPGESLEVPDPDGKDTLVIIGQLTITTPVKKVSYKRVVVAGQLLVPRGSEAAIANVIHRCDGVISYYGENPRVFTGNEHFGKDFFEYLNEPICLVLTGNFEISKEVTREILKPKVSEIILTGRLTAPKELIGLLQVLTTEKSGYIVPLKEQ